MAGIVRNNPILGVQDVSTPLLLSHGDADGAVSFLQSVEMFTSLRRHGKPVALLRYRGEDHEHSAGAALDFNQRMLELYEHFLNGKPAPCGGASNSSQPPIPFVPAAALVWVSADFHPGVSMAAALRSFVPLALLASMLFVPEPALAQSPPPQQHPQPSLRSWTPDDSVALRYFLAEKNNSAALVGDLQPVATVRRCSRPTAGISTFVRCDARGSMSTTTVAGRPRMHRRAKFPERAPKPGFEVVVRESLNEPQRVVASASGREIELVGPDPLLKGLARAQAEPIVWTDSAGREAGAVLMLPPGREHQKPFPVVIQLGDPTVPVDAFRPDGEFGTAFAAQALAAQGFAVLQLESGNFDHKTQRIIPELHMNPREGPAQVTRIDDAMQMLRARGIADERPIGLIGFSRSGYHTYYIATHPGKTAVGAAIVFDSVTHGFGDYVMNAAMYLENDTASESVYGGPFWDRREAWLDAPAFNVHRGSAAMLFMTNADNDNVPALPGETVGALFMVGRPFEYQLLPHGGHSRVPSRIRAAAMQNSVDWMRFWLTGRDPEPNAYDPQRAERWREIRARWEQRRSAVSN